MDGDDDVFVCYECTSKDAYDALMQRRASWKTSKPRRRQNLRPAKADPRVHAYERALMRSRNRSSNGECSFEVDAGSEETDEHGHLCQIQEGVDAAMRATAAVRGKAEKILSANGRYANRRQDLEVGIVTRDTDGPDGKRRLKTKWFTVLACSQAEAARKLGIDPAAMYNILSGAQEFAVSRVGSFEGTVFSFRRRGDSIVRRLSSNDPIQRAFTVATTTTRTGSGNRNEESSDDEDRDLNAESIRKLRSLRSSYKSARYADKHLKSCDFNGDNGAYDKAFTFAPDRILAWAITHAPPSDDTDEETTNESAGEKDEDDQAEDEGGDQEEKEDENNRIARSLIKLDVRKEFPPHGTFKGRVESYDERAGYVWFVMYPLYTYVYMCVCVCVCVCMRVWSHRGRLWCRREGDLRHHDRRRDRGVQGPGRCRERGRAQGRVAPPPSPAGAGGGGDRRAGGGAGALGGDGAGRRLQLQRVGSDQCAEGGGAQGHVGIWQGDRGHCKWQ